MVFSQFDWPLRSKQRLSWLDYTSYWIDTLSYLTLNGFYPLAMRLVTLTERVRNGYFFGASECFQSNYITNTLVFFHVVSYFSDFRLCFFNCVFFVDIVNYDRNVFYVLFLFLDTVVYEISICFDASLYFYDMSVQARWRNEFGWKRTEIFSTWLCFPNVPVFIFWYFYLNSQSVLKQW